jgi:hypothetical protein
MLCFPEAASEKEATADQKSREKRRLTLESSIETGFVVFERFFGSHQKRLK